MDSQRAVKLLDETFNQEFDIERFAIFINELFNHFKFKKNFEEDSVPLSTEYNDYIEKLQSLGVYRDSNKETIEVFAVKLKRDSSVEKARTMQRNSIANYLKKFNRNASLVAFYGDNPEDWRFSLVKVDYELFKDEKGNLKVDEKLTPAKRYSFLVGKNEPNHTCRSQFLPLIEKETEDPTVEEIETAFSVEKVTKEFFNEYKELFLRLKDSLDKIIGKDPVIKAEFDEKNIITADFAKKLMGQIVFIYFLQKKGWLGVEMDQEWGTGPKNFLRTLYDKKDYDNFFNDVLEHLFYDALATDRYDDYYEKFECKIPFLNGGLFEPINLYNWRKTGIKIDNKIFGDILNTFDLFNFTIKEDEPLERIVAVDPEMLGKVFENLLEVKDRKSKGAFYTPREIVHYMCQQSLINYLGTHLEIPKEDIESFIQLGDFALDSIIRAKELGQSSKMYALPESIIAEKDIIDKLIDEVKIVDPAVGSGAFLVGMMNEMLKVKSILSLLKDEINVNYDIKHQIIENSLYGVDLDSSAVDITKLRFWLSLIVDEESIDDIKPLPNLDHKVMCGNSLLEEYNGLKLFDENILLEKPKEKKELKQITLYDERLQESRKKLKRLRELQKLYFNEQNKRQKDSYRAEIDKIEWELIEETLKEEGNEEAIQKLEHYKKGNSKPFFLWKLYFAEVFQRKNPGFDVVVANPPYGIVYDEAFKKMYEDKFETFKRNNDIYVAFYENGLFLLRNNGTIVYITPNTFLNGDYFKLLRKKLTSEVIITEIHDFKNVHIFDDPTVFVAVLSSIKKREVNYPYTFNIKTSKDSIANFDEELIEIEKKSDKPLKARNPILRKILGIPNIELIDNIFYVKDVGFNYWTKGRGKKRGGNSIGKRVFYKGKQLDSKDIPFLKGRNIVKYYIDSPNNYLKHDYESYLDYEVDTFRFSENFLKQNPKIIYRQTSNKIVATIDFNSYFLDKTVHLIVPKEDKSSLDLKYVLALLNSRLFNYLYQYVSQEMSGRTFAQVKTTYIKQLPVKLISILEQKAYIELINQIFEITRNNDYLTDDKKQNEVKKLENELDKLIYDLYELTPKERKIIGNFNQE
ncbi:MAG: TaqI-like C-terminal specificity domain-containing protein [Methanobacterium sp.]|jgi:hypothetical protein